MHRFFSNSFDYLFERLITHLFDAKMPLLSKRVILVSGALMKRFVSRHMADKLKISFGFEVLLISEAITRYSALTPPASFKSFYLIDQELRAILEERDPLFDPLRHYLGEGKEKKRLQFAQTLAKLFTHYMHYAPHILRKNQKSFHGSWQFALQERLKNHLNYAALEGGVGFFNCAQVHIFIPQYLSQAELQFFHALQKQTELYYYGLSPCAEDFSDQKRRGDVNETHPILGAFGTLLRVNENTIDDKADGQRFYSLPLKGERASFLHTVQKDLLTLTQDKKSVPLNDHSITVHISPNKTRELEALYQALLGFLGDKKDAKAKDVLVLVPDIHDYVPYIKQIFLSETSQLPIEILDLEKAIHNPFVKVFKGLIEFLNSRYKLNDFLSLLYCVPIQRSLKLSVKDVDKIVSLLKKMQVTFGFDVNHRKRLIHDLGDSHPQGTFAFAFDTLVQAFAYSDTPFRLNFSQSEMIATVIRFMHTLYDLTEKIYDNPLRESKEWVEFIENNIMTFLQPMATDKEELRGEEDILEALDKLKHLGGTSSYSLTTFLAFIDELLHKKQRLKREGRVDAICFASLACARAIPAKVIAIIGMDEGAFPRYEEMLDCNLLQDTKIFYPRSKDVDEALFLETLLSVKERLILSSSISLDHKTAKPSPIITRFLSFLDELYEGKPSEHIVHIQKIHGHHPAYFDAQTPLLNFAKRDFQISQKQQSKEKVPSITPFALRGIEVKNEKKHLVYCQDLPFFGRHPLGYFLRKSLKIKNFYEEENLGEDVFSLNALDRSMLLRNELMNTCKDHKKYLEESFKLPIGPFKQVVWKKIDQDISVLRETLKEHIVFDVVFQEECQKPLFDTKTLYLPPMTLSIPRKGEIKFLGRIPQALYLLKKESFSEMVAAYPIYLLLHAAKKRYSLDIAPKMVFLHSQTTKEPVIDDIDQAMQEYFSYYLEALNTPIPLLAKFVEPLLKKDLKKLDAQLQEALFGAGALPKDPYISWGYRFQSLPSAEEFILPWYHLAKKLFFIFS